MSEQARRARTTAKINLALVVGRPRADGLHPVATVLQRVDLADWLEVRPAASLEGKGFEDDVIVHTALERLSAAAGLQSGWSATLEKAIPVAAGLGGGSSDAACALRLANDLLAKPLPKERLYQLASGLGADVPFFLEPGPKLAEGVGEVLTPLRLPQDFWVVIAIPAAATKHSTGDIYRRFDELGGGAEFEDRRAEMLTTLEQCRQASDLAALPVNDLAVAACQSELPEQLLAAGAFRADVSGAGPAVYALFENRNGAARAVSVLPEGTLHWVVSPVW
jgi:4-diphosphocytidyl-2-C-methyl-D-erythritol kinase